MQLKTYQSTLNIIQTIPIIIQLKEMILDIKSIYEEVLLPNRHIVIEILSVFPSLIVYNLWHKVWSAMLRKNKVRKANIF